MSLKKFYDILTKVEQSIEDVKFVVEELKNGNLALCEGGKVVYRYNGITDNLEYKLMCSTRWFVGNGKGLFTFDRFITEEDLDNLTEVTRLSVSPDELSLIEEFETIMSSMDN